MTLANHFEFIIIGGGVMGASTAYHLAARGFKKVLLLEKDEFFGQGAPTCAGGCYQFATEINIRLSIEPAHVGTLRG
jgi:sarcosine oxidase subunit beta